MLNELRQNSDERFNDFFAILKERMLFPLYQPIVDLNRQNIFGYESLIRGPADSPYHGPTILFDAAVRTGRLIELEMLCRELGIAKFQQNNVTGKLFLNASPESLLEPEHRSGLTLDILSKAGISPENVVIELTEQYPLNNFNLVRQAMEHYKSMGFEIAIDDLGAGYSGLRRWSELQPNYVKIDRHFIQGIHEDEVKQSFVRSINDIAKGLHCKVIAEGIETRDEFRTLFAMGITLGQGYYFARPEAHPPSRISAELFVCQSTDIDGKPVNNSAKNISGLIVNVADISSRQNLQVALDRFHEDDNLTAIPVLSDKGMPLGLIRRQKILAIFATQYGRSLYANKPISSLMDEASVTVESEWGFDKVSRLVTDTMKVQIEDDFIITENGHYSGLGKVVDLLKMITDFQIRNARHANPLTMLPGNVPIYEMLDEVLNTKKEFYVAYCDIDNFKPFNDVYGYEKGDQILKKLGLILTRHSDPDMDFVGHVGGDDFILIFKSEDWRERCNEILNDFKNEVLTFYSDIDRNNQGIWAKTRNGEKAFYPIMSLSIGAIKPDVENCISHEDIASIATQAKRFAKEIPGNSLFFERRTMHEEA